MTKSGKKRSVGYEQKNGEFYYLPHAFELDHSDIDVILHLKESYLRRFKSEELSDEKNYRQMLGFLFYNFPSLEISPDASKYSLSADRKKIDTLAEKIGVKSQTMNSIIKSVSDLLEELVNVSLHLCS